MKLFIKLLGLLIAAVVIMVATRVVMAGDWRQASREPTGIAPNPALTREAVVQVYVARAYGWRGVFGVHSWVAVKPTDAAEFTVYEVIGWRVMHGLSAVRISHRPPDGRWFGSTPRIIADIRGPGVDAVIKRIDAQARAYPRPHDYTIWPGPNSNTFTAYLGRVAPELKMDLPPTAIGKDFLIDGFSAAAPSGSGYQVSLFGLLGLLVAKEEGVEINILGLVFGFDAAKPAVKLPIAGRIGL